MNKMIENTPRESIITNDMPVENASSDLLINLNHLPEDPKRLQEIVTQQEYEISFLYSQLEALEIKLVEAEKHFFEDKLTGCFNINYYNKFKEENYNPQTDQNKIAIVYCDANGLKQLNDTPIELGGGHDAGDRMIVDMSVYLRRSVKEEDTVVRPYGFGDEFILIIRNSTGNGDFEEYVNFKIDKMREEAKNNNPPLDFATGVAVTKKDEELDDVKKRAESDMYLKKANMKNGKTATEA